MVSRQIEDTRPYLSGRPTPASTSSNHEIETYPGFKIPEFSKEKFPKLSDTFEVTGSIIEKPTLNSITLTSPKRKIKKVFPQSKPIFRKNQSSPKTWK